MRTTGHPAPSWGRGQEAPAGQDETMLNSLEDNAEDAANFLKMLASGPRLMLLCHMADGEISVGRLAELTGMRMPTVSQQLALLRAQGLVSTRRDGTTIYYRLDSAPAREVMVLLQRHFCPVDAAEAPQKALAKAD